MEKHSAEFLRGVVFGMHAAGIDSVAREQLVDKYRTLLAQAEASDAAPDAAAVIAQCRKALEQLHAYVNTSHVTYLDRTEEGDRLRTIKYQASEFVRARKHLDALSAIAAWEASNGK